MLERRRLDLVDILLRDRLLLLCSNDLVRGKDGHALCKAGNGICEL